MSISTPPIPLSTSFLKFRGPTPGMIKRSGFPDMGSAVAAAPSPEPLQRLSLCNNSGLPSELLSCSSSASPPSSFPSLSPPQLLLSKLSDAHWAPSGPPCNQAGRTADSPALLKTTHGLCSGGCWSTEQRKRIGFRWGAAGLSGGGGDGDVRRWKAVGMGNGMDGRDGVFLGLFLAFALIQGLGEVQRSGLRRQSFCISSTEHFSFRGNFFFLSLSLSC